MSPVTATYPHAGTDAQFRYQAIVFFGIRVGFRMSSLSSLSEAIFKL